MSALNPKCHNKGCQCASCEFICSRCCAAGKCSNSTCHSDHGMQNCSNYTPEDTSIERRAQI